MKKKQVKQKQSIHFRRWNRKNYSVFNSLHKVVNIGVLCTACFITLLSNNASAQEKQSDSTRISNYELDEVVVESELPIEIQSKQTRIISVINRAEIQRSTASTLDDLLEYALNVDIRNRGKNGTQADISIRGGSFDQVMILLNGINITDPQTGHHNLAIPISLDAVDRIEILSGPGAIKWGANAFSGAVNIVTKAQGKNVSAEIEGGQFGSYNTQITAHTPIGKTNNIISVGASGSDGYIHNTDYKNKSIFYLGKLSDKSGNTEWQFGHINRAHGANGFYTPKYPNQFEQAEVTMASIKWESTGRVKLSPSLYYRRNKSNYNLFRDGNATFGGYVPNYHINEVFGANITATYISKWGTTQIGGTIRNESIISNKLGNPMNDSIPIKGVDSICYTNGYSRTNTTWFLEHKVTLNKFYGAVTAMLNHNSALPNTVGFFPGLEMSYNFNSTWNMYTNINRSMRMPSFTDLFYQGPENRGNPLLKPETAMTYEAGVKYNNHSGIHAHLSYFLREATNLIDWVKSDASQPWTTVNHDAVNTQGIEVASAFDFEQIMDAPFFIKNIKVGYAYMNATQKTKTENSKELSNYEGAYLKHKFNLNIYHAIYSSLYANWNIAYQYRNGEYEKYDGKADVGVVNYTPFWLTDVKVMWKRPKYEIYSEVSNLFNIEYNDIGNLLQPGRLFTVGVKFRMGS